MEVPVPLWTNNPKVLMKKPDFWPFGGATLTVRSNAAARLVILSTFLLFLIIPRPSLLMTGMACLAALALMTRQLVREGTQKELGSMLKEGFQSLSCEAVSKVRWTQPTEKNPLMNVMLPEISDNPNRPRAAPAYVPSVEVDINNKTQKMVENDLGNSPGLDARLFKDLGDSFNFDRSMINFNATANTQIPNDQKGFADFCYGNMPSAKEGTPKALLEGLPPRVIDGS